MDLEAVLLLGGWLSWVISDLPSVLVLVVAWFVAVRIRWRDLWQSTQSDKHHQENFIKKSKRITSRLVHSTVFFSGIRLHTQNAFFFLRITGQETGRACSMIEVRSPFRSLQSLLLCSGCRSASGHREWATPNDLVIATWCTKRWLNPGTKPALPSDNDQASTHALPLGYMYITWPLLHMWKLQARSALWTEKAVAWQVAKLTPLSTGAEEPLVLLLRNLAWWRCVLLENIQ
jgi:hypothetical protein